MSDSAALVASLESFTLAEAACAWVGVPLSLAGTGVTTSQWTPYPGKLEEWRTVLKVLRDEAAKGPLGSLNLGAPIVRCRGVKAGKVLEFSLRTGAGALVDGVSIEYFLDVDVHRASREALRKFAELKGAVPPFLSSTGTDGGSARVTGGGDSAKGATTPHGKQTERRVIALLALLLSGKADKWRRPGNPLPDASVISEDAAELATFIEKRAQEQDLPVKYQGLKADNIRRLISESLRALKDE